MNILETLLCGVAFMVIGMLWYSPALFSKRWMKLVGKTKADMKPEGSEMAKLYGSSFIASLVMAWVLAMFISLGGPDANTFPGGMWVGFMAWLGFAAPVTFINNMYQGKQFMLTVIDSGYILASLLAFGAIINWIN